MPSGCHYFVRDKDGLTVYSTRGENSPPISFSLPSVATPSPIPAIPPAVESPSSLSKSLDTCILWNPPVSDSAFSKIEVELAKWDSNGRHMAMSHSHHLSVFKNPISKSFTNSLSHSIPIPVELPNTTTIKNKVKFIQWSPLSTYLVVNFHSNTVQDSQDFKNLKIWSFASHYISNSDSNISSISLEGEFSVKYIHSQQWPIVQWRYDEMYSCAFLNRHELSIYSNSFQTPLFRIEILNLFSFLVAPVSQSEDLQILYFSFSNPQISPSKFGLLHIVDTLKIQETCFKTSQTVNPIIKQNLKESTEPFYHQQETLYPWIQMIIQQQMEMADSVEMSWNPSGTAILVLAMTTVDAAGENYGGVGDCWFGRSDGSIVCKVNKHVVQDARWSPVRDEFILIEGKSPSAISLYDNNCKMQFSFPPGYRNTIRWCPFGLMVALGGFGNLAGDLSFWYRDSDTRSMRLIAEWQEPFIVTCEWAPDGIHFLTASTFPRMKVDNFYKIWTYEGQLVTMHKSEQLFEAQWCPHREHFPIPPLPQPRENAERPKVYRPKSIKDRLSLPLETPIGGHLPKVEVMKKKKEKGIVSNEKVPLKRSEENGTAEEVENWRATDESRKLITTVPSPSSEFVSSKSTVPQSEMEYTEDLQSRTVNPLSSLLQPEISVKNSAEKSKTILPMDGKWATQKDNVKLFTSSLPSQQTVQTPSDRTLPKSTFPLNHMPSSNLILNFLHDQNSKKPKSFASIAPSSQTPLSHAASPLFSSISSSFPSQPTPVSRSKSPLSYKQFKFPLSEEALSQTDLNSSNVGNFFIDSDIQKPSSERSMSGLFPFQSKSIPSYSTPTSTYPNPTFQTSSNLGAKKNSNSNYETATMIQLMHDHFSKLPKMTPSYPKDAPKLDSVKDKRPNAMKDVCWQYVDPKGTIQGPFHIMEMRAWNEMGYFDPYLPVRCCESDKFVSLRLLYPQSVSPFSIPPRPQPIASSSTSTASAYPKSSNYKSAY